MEMDFYIVPDRNAVWANPDIVHSPYLPSFSILRCSIKLVVLRSIASCRVSCPGVRPRDLLLSIFPSISCSCDDLCLIRCPRYCNFIVLNCVTITLPVPILLNTSSLVIFSVHDIFNILRYIHISKASISLCYVIIYENATNSCAKIDNT